MSIRIVVTGSECTGKTTLAKALADAYGVPYAPEYLREYFAMKNGTLAIEDAVPIAKGQIAGEMALEKQGVNPIICDTNIISSVVYSRHYFGECPKWIEAQLAVREYHHYFLCGVDVPWQADGQRDRPEHRDMMQDEFRNELARRGVPFTELTGSLEERLEKAVTIVKGLLTS